VTYEQLIAHRQLKKRALRRAVKQRRKERALRLGKPIKRADHMCCPCWMCSNTRRLEGPTYQEVRFACIPLDLV